MSRAKRKAIQKRKNTENNQNVTVKIDTEKMGEFGETISQMLEISDGKENFASAFAPTVGVCLTEIPKNIAVLFFESLLPQIRTEAAAEIVEDVKKSNTVVIRLT